MQLSNDVKGHVMCRTGLDKLQYVPPEIKPIQVFSNRSLTKVDGDLSEVWTHIAVHCLFQTQWAAHQGWRNVIAEGAYLGLEAQVPILNIAQHPARKSSALPSNCTPEEPDKRSNPVTRIC